jgi:rubrerythrin
MGKFICKQCRYRFASKEDQWLKTCPYCDEKGVVEEPDADDLLSDIDDF